MRSTAPVPAKPEPEAIERFGAITDTDVLCHVLTNVITAVMHGDMKIDTAHAIYKGAERIEGIRYMEIKRAAVARLLGDANARIGAISLRSSDRA